MGQSQKSSFVFSVHCHLHAASLDYHPKENDTSHHRLINVCKMWQPSMDLSPYLEVQPVLGLFVWCSCVGCAEGLPGTVSQKPPPHICLLFLFKGLCFSLSLHLQPAESNNIMQVTSSFTVGLER